MIEENNNEKSIKMMPLSFYKAGGVFTGSVDTTRYMVKKEASEEAEMLAAFAWPGPYRFDATEDSLKTSEKFELSEDGIKKAAEWLEKAC